MLGVLLLILVFAYVSRPAVHRALLLQREKENRAGVPRAKRGRSAQQHWTSWDLKGNAQPANPANVAFYPGEVAFTRNKNNLVNQNGGRDFKRRLKKMQNTNFHRTPKERSPEATKNYRMQSSHAMVSMTGVGIKGAATGKSRLGKEHFATTSKWIPHTGGAVNPSKYNRPGGFMDSPRQWQDPEYDTERRMSPRGMGI